MQGQGSTIDSFPESVNIDQGSVSNNTGMNEQTSLDNMLNPLENRLSNYTVASGGATCVGSVTSDVQSFSGWNSGEPSSRLSSQNQVNEDEMKMEHDWSSSYTACIGVGSRSEESRFEPTSILFPGRRSVGRSGSQIRSGPLLSQGSSSNNVQQNVNLSSGYVNNSGNGGPGMTAAGGLNLGTSGGLETEQAYSSGGATDNVGTSSGSSGFMEENSGGSGSSLGGWGLSCKRKALEGTSGQSCSAGSSSCFPQAENAVWHAGPTRYDASSSLSLSLPSQNSPSICPPEQPNPRFGFPSSGIAGNTENRLRNFGRRGGPGNQQDYLPFNSSLTGNAGRLNAAPPPVPLPFSDSLDLRSTTALVSNSIAAQSQPPAIHVSALSRNVHSFPWNGASSSRAGNLSSSIISGERGAALRDEANLRSIPRNNAEHPMLLPSAEIRTMVQDPTSWSLATGSSSGGASSTARAGSSVSIHPLPAPTWIPHNPTTHNHQRLTEFAPWSLFPSSDSESGGRGNHFSPLSAGPSSSQEAVMPSGSNSQVYPQPLRRSSLLVERHNDDVLGMPRSLQALAADIEGRHRLISEIRQVLNAMRRGENLRIEDYMLFDPFMYHGLAELHDRHRDMRLDVDNMSYEELLALEERIGDVSTGLSEETILKLMKQKKYISIAIEVPLDQEPCCICQEDYADGDDLGMLDCGHDFHNNCIKQWLMQKNLCPICKTAALPT
ncbi:E3 ubiquitin-protein ligase MBR2-like [Mangifera indica]|uniref:E3 ubiquitin-protein ligase MBR2-like n=1 Tax=Mangifera indica TaxID=29780 RepID=UPI001CFC21CF|nr:E3 ubiquitin-protein ligase MBR2-like [Mangifera indica]